MAALLLCPFKGISMKHRPPHILNASTNLLGICFVVITGLRLANVGARSYADEVAWLAAILLFVAALCAYLALRNDNAPDWMGRVADAAFLAGMTALGLSVMIVAAYI